MKKKYAVLFVLVLSASIAFSAPSILAYDSAAKQASDTTLAVLTTNSSQDSTANTTTGTQGDTSTNTQGNTSTNTAEPASTPADNSTLNLSLDDALKLVDTGNKDLKLADDKIAIYEKQKEQALARQDAAKNGGTFDEDTKKDLSLNYGRAQWTLDNAKHDRENQLKNLKVQITNEYENILTLQQLGGNTKKQLANVEKLIDQVNLQIKLGLKVPTDIYSYNVQKTKLEAALESTQNNINSSMITLKQDLGIDLNRNVILTSDLIPYTRFNNSDIDNVIAKAVKINYDLGKYQKDIELSQTEYDIDFFYDDNINANQVQLSIEDKKGTLDNLTVTQEVSLRTAYNNLKSLENTINSDQLTVEADQINIDIMQKNIDAGVNSSLDMISLQNTLLNDQYTLQQDINNCMTASANFQNSLDD